MYGEDEIGYLAGDIRVAINDACMEIKDKAWNELSNNISRFDTVFNYLEMLRMLLFDKFELSK